jgi:divalent metal cation (Fe/Co/Zn/Cd) transporter
VDSLEHEIRLRIPEESEVHTHIEMATKGVQVVDRVSEALEKTVIDEIHRVVASMPSLDNPHNIIVRRNRGEKETYSVSLECTIAPETPVSDAHQLSTALERELSDRLDGVEDVLVHLEPPTN